MARDYDRMLRIGDLLQQHLSLLLRKEIHHPDLGMVTVASVKVSKDLSVANVYITCLGEPESIERSMAVLHASAKMLRSKLARAVNLRVTPELRFFYDASLEKNARIAQLLRDVKDEPED